MVEKMKTGTTCIGFKFKDGIILAADRKATGGLMKLDFIKIFDLSENIVTTIAGTASSCQLVVRHLQKEIKAIEMKNERKSTIKEISSVANQFQYSLLRSGEVVGLIIGGYDEKRNFSLFDLGADGTIQERNDYCVDGSGSVFVKSIFDNEYNKNITKEEGLKIIEKSFKTSFRNDYASGGGYAVKIITKNNIETIVKKLAEDKFIEEKM